MAAFKCETAGSAKRSWRQADAAIDTAEGFDANHQQGSPSVLRVASPAETSRNEGDDEEPPADWTKSKIDWQWEQARRTRFGESFKDFRLQGERYRYPDRARQRKTS